MQVTNEELKWTDKNDMYMKSVLFCFFLSLFPPGLLCEVLNFQPVL